MHETAGQDDVARLLEFLRGRDVPCPLCRYSLRDLTRPQCPECHHELLLTVGVTRPRFLWFLLAVTPCTFSGIAVGLLLIPMIVRPLTGGGPPQPPIFALDALGWLSALGGLPRSLPVRIPPPDAQPAAYLRGGRVGDPRAGLPGVLPNRPHR